MDGDPCCSKMKYTQWLVTMCENTLDERHVLLYASIHHDEEMDIDIDVRLPVFAHPMNTDTLTLEMLFVRLLCFARVNRRSDLNTTLRNEHMPRPNDYVRSSAHWTGIELNMNTIRYILTRQCCIDCKRQIFVQRMANSIADYVQGQNDPSFSHLGDTIEDYHKLTCFTDQRTSIFSTCVEHSSAWFIN